MAASAEEKIRAVKHLLQYGYRGNEWAEAGLLRAVDKVFYDETKESWTDFDLQGLIEEAGDY